ncbi:MAG: 4Fe-4S cluster-binding domain-containing protein, partial [Pyramidobacter sp.]|nr:4Fe-4S cluster-binding domain-containing protein [Pyramidobacter sp.]
GCHNPCTHNPFGGFEMDTADVIEQIRSLHLQQGITLSCGEPFLQPRPLVEIVRAARLCGLNVWSFTGYTFEQLIDANDPAYNDRMELLKLIDVLVDGRFVREKRDLSLRFRGSSNQRIIDVQRSLRLGAACTIEEYMKKAM